MKLKGKVAIVTGTSPNIGGGIAEGLAAEGAQVACVDLDPANAKDCADAISKSGGTSLAVPTNVAVPEEVEASVDRISRELGSVDLLVNNAAMFLVKGVLDMSYEEWSKQLGVILDGSFLCTKSVASRMVERGEGGCIINVISTAGHQGQPGNVGYCTGKSGLLNFTRSVAMELAPHGIRVNSLTPTATDPSEAFDRAERWGRSRPSEDVFKLMEPFRKGVPLQQLPGPTDYARAIVFLASDDARFMTGADLRVDSGAVGRYWAWDPSRTD